MVTGGRIWLIVLRLTGPDATRFQFCLMASIVSRSPLKPPMPLVTPPPPDHCHISAYGLELVWPPKNCAHGPAP
jgi:hypothetical protein